MTTNPEDFVGATATLQGKTGRVPAPQSGDQAKALLGDGTFGYQQAIADSPDYPQTGGGTLETLVNTLGNTGTGEDNLHAFALPYSATAFATFAAVGDRVVIKASGAFADTADVKTIKAYIGTDLVFTTGAQAFQNDIWQLEIELVRVAATAVASNLRAFARFWTSDVLTVAPQNTLVSSIDFATALTVKTTAEATTTNDVTEYSFSVTHFKGN